MLMKEIDTTTTFIGIDVSKKTIHIYNEKSKMIDEIVNDESVIVEYFKAIQEEVTVFFEPTGTYSKSVEKALNQTKTSYNLINPKDAHDFMKAM